MKGTTSGRGGLLRRWWGVAPAKTVAQARAVDDASPAAHPGRYGDAERLLIAAVKRAERQSDDFAGLAGVIARLADLYRAQGRYDEAERLYQRAIGVIDMRGEEPAALAVMLNNLALVYRAQGMYHLAEPLCRRALAIAEREHGSEHALTAAAVRNLMTVYLAQHRYREAGPLFRRAVALRERVLGPQHPALAGSMSTYAAFLRHTRADDEAAVWEARAEAIRGGRRR
jgi:tetratricopeptide (TPR) repeat protein